MWVFTRGEEILELHVSGTSHAAPTRRLFLQTTIQKLPSYTKNIVAFFFTEKMPKINNQFTRCTLKLRKSADDQMQICWLQTIWESAIGMQEDRLPAIVEQGGNQNKTTTLSCAGLQLRLWDACLLSMDNLRIRQQSSFPNGMQLYVLLGVICLIACKGASGRQSKVPIKWDHQVQSTLDGAHRPASVCKPYRMWGIQTHSMGHIDVSYRACLCGSKTHSMCPFIDGALGQIIVSHIWCALSSVLQIEVAYRCVPHLIE